MGIREVENAVLQIRTRAQEWDKMDLGHWREVDVRYSFVDPIIQALGWNTADPKECYPEYQRGQGFVDYALFGIPDIGAIGSGEVAPDVVIESKKLDGILDSHISKLRKYTSSSPRMGQGVAVLTDGNTWLLYDLSKRGAFRAKRVDQLEILCDSLDVIVTILDQWVGRERFR